MVTTIQNQISEALETIRPYLQADGGDVEIVEVTASSDVILRLTGACSTCEMSEMTMTAGIEETLRKSIPGLGKISAIR
ncbi:MAG: NifU family protein [Bacteroidia bacterium]|jgi:Fe-S cluster biogenesis protein NfuA